MKKIIFKITLLAFLPIIIQSAEIANNNDKMLIDGIRSKNLQSVHESLKNGANIECIIDNMSLCRPLHLAVIHGDYHIVSALINARANVNVRDISQWTPLHLATIDGHPNIINLLIEAKANIDLKTIYNRTALNLAANHNKTDAVKLLILAKACIDITDDWQKTPLHNAVSNSNCDIVKLLLESGSDYKLKDNEGNTALTLANQKFIDKEFSIEAITEFIKLRETGLIEIPKLILDQTTLPLPLGNLIAQYCYAFCESEKNTNEKEKDKR